MSLSFGHCPLTENTSCDISLIGVAYQPEWHSGTNSRFSLQESLLPCGLGHPLQQIHSNKLAFGRYFVY